MAAADKGIAAASLAALRGDREDSLVGYDCFAPLLFGRFSQPPRRTGRNSDVVKVEFSIDEDSPAAYLAGGRLGLSAALIEQTRARFASACAGWPARIEASFLSAERKTRYLTLLAQRRERLGGL